MLLLLAGVAMLTPASAVSVTPASGQIPAAYEASSPIARSHVFRLPRSATHVAVHWKGASDAVVRLAFGRDGNRFRPARRVALDEAGEGRTGNETYGAIMLARGARAVRVTTNRPLRRLSLLALTDRGRPLVLRPGVRSLSAVAQPAVIPRSGWVADESLRFDASGRESWPPAFWPIQKVLVHHTATQNGDPNPAATIRSIYQYHAVTQAWGDIGYNFLIDEAGNVYEGRYSREYAGQPPTGQDLNGNGVTAAHAQGYNSGTVGIALLGTLTDRDTTPAARSALEKLIAWIDDARAIDPQGASLYTNPVSGAQATFANIAGHRDVNATECPGGSFYATLPQLRSAVAALIGSTQRDFTVAATPTSASTTAGGSVSYAVSVGAVNGFSGDVGLAVSGLPAGATPSFAPSSVVAAPGSSQLIVTSSSATAAGSYALTISGTNGARTRTASVSFVVNPSSDFGVSVSPSSRTVKRGGSASYTVNVSSQGGFAGDVALSIAGLPSGSTATFSPPSPVSAPKSSTLAIRTSSSTPRGTFALTVTGTSGIVARNAKATLIVKSG